MGYLNGATIVVDAILTKHGRRNLSAGQGLGITKYALSDDHIDYSLWNPDHASGSVSYGEAIVNLPMTEVTPDDSTVMHYKLITLDRNTKYLPVARLALGSADGSAFIRGQGMEHALTLSPETGNFRKEQWEFKFPDRSGLIITGGTQKDISGIVGSPPAALKMPEAAIYVGNSIQVSAAPTDAALTTRKVVMTGMESGAFTELLIKIERNIRPNLSPVP